VSANPPPARTALVTGANRGLGRGLALGLAAGGVAVGLVGRRREALDDVAREIADAGGTAAVAVADVRSWDATRAAVRELETALGGIDLLVNNAGVIEPVEVPVWEADPDGWWDVVEVDLRGPFHCVRAVVPGMVERGGGRVIDLNSGAGAKDRENYSAYCAAKAGLFRIGGNLHLAGFGRGLRAFEVSPGVVESDMTHSMPMHADRTEWTSIDDLVGIAVSIARGELDAWSGCFLRAGADTPESLAAAAAELAADGSVPAPARRLGVVPFGPADTLVGPTERPA
jgi:NAD(P)-dependent dehydrogenase (short-subunit alcohol dehydrogenase family)